MNQDNKTKSPEQNQADKSVKTTAVDTGRRVDVKGAVLRSHMKKPATRSARPAKPQTEREEPRAAPMSEAKPPIESERPKSQSVERKIPLYVEPVEFDETGD